MLWNTLMGTTVYDCGNPDTEGAHIFCHSRRDGDPGVVYLIINNSLTESTHVDLPQDALRYTLGAETMRASTMQLNGKNLVISDEPGLPQLMPEKQSAGTMELAPGTCTFLVL